MPNIQITIQYYTDNSVIGEIMQFLSIINPWVKPKYNSAIELCDDHFYSNRKCTCRGLRERQTKRKKG